MAPVAPVSFDPNALSSEPGRAPRKNSPVASMAPLGSSNGGNGGMRAYGVAKKAWSPPAAEVSSSCREPWGELPPPMGSIPACGRDCPSSRLQAVRLGTKQEHFLTMSSVEGMIQQPRRSARSRRATRGTAPQDVLEGARGRGPLFLNLRGAAGKGRADPSLGLPASGLRDAHIVRGARTPRSGSRFLSNIRRLRPFPTKWGRCRAKPDGWGVESRNASSKVRSFGRASLPASKQRAIPHPAGHRASGRTPVCRRAVAGLLPQQSWGRGAHIVRGARTPPRPSPSGRRCRATPGL